MATTVQATGAKTWRLSPAKRQVAFKVVTVLLTLYLSFGGLIWWSMRQPPEVFGRVMSKLPAPIAFLFFPFETLWTHARAGTLNVGDPAPDFSLSKVDKSNTVTLSSLIQQGPVVLVFGSYT